MIWLGDSKYKCKEYVFGNLSQCVCVTYGCRMGEKVDTIYSPTNFIKVTDNFKK